MAHATTRGPTEWSHKLEALLQRKTRDTGERWTGSRISREARKYGYNIKDAVFYNLLTGNTKSPDLTTQVVISDVFGVPLTELSGIEPRNPIWIWVQRRMLERHLNMTSVSEATGIGITDVKRIARGGWGHPDDIWNLARYLDIPYDVFTREMGYAGPGTITVPRGVRQPYEYVIPDDVLDQVPLPAPEPAPANGAAPAASVESGTPVADAAEEEEEEEEIIPVEADESAPVLAPEPGVPIDLPAVARLPRADTPDVANSAQSRDNIFAWTVLQAVHEAVDHPPNDGEWPNNAKELVNVLVIAMETKHVTRDTGTLTHLLEALLSPKTPPSTALLIRALRAVTQTRLSMLDEAIRQVIHHTLEELDEHSS